MRKKDSESAIVFFKARKERSCETRSASRKVFPVRETTILPTQISISDRKKDWLGNVRTGLSQGKFLLRGHARAVGALRKTSQSKHSMRICHAKASINQPSPHEKKNSQQKSPRPTESHPSPPPNSPGSKTPSHTPTAHRSSHDA